MSVAPLRLVGFRAELDGASLWDLVQMECQTRSRLVVQVRGDTDVGFLYFADGRIVHAATAALSGELAALEILGWTRGSFQPCDRPWPASPTIETPCEALILNVAKRRDDEGASNLVAFPDVGIGALDEKGIADMRSPNIEPPALAPLGRGELTAEFPVVLRIGQNGAVLKNKGASEEMAGVVAYAHRLVQLAGELLGLEDLSAIECQFTEGRCLIFSEENGDLVALRPRADTSLQAIRERLGL